MKNINESKKDKALSKKAKLSGVPKSILSRVYSKGLAAWRGGHRPGVPQHQWAMGRVNSFITGSGGARKVDADLWAKARKAKARKKKRKSVKEELDILRKKIRNIIKENLLNELKYNDLTPKEKSDYNKRNEIILQSKVQPLNLKYQNEYVELTPKIKFSQDWIEYELSERNNAFFSLSLKDEKELNVYLTSKLWDYDVNEFNLGVNIIDFLNKASDYLNFLDKNVIKKVQVVINYILRKKESYLNKTIKL